MHGAKIKREGQNFSEWNIKIKKHIGIDNEGFNEDKVQNGKADVCHSGLSTSLHEKWSLRACSENACCPSNKISSTQSHPTRFSHMGASLQVHVLNCASSTKSYTGSVWQCKYCALEPLFRSDVWVTIQFSTKHTNWLGP